MVAMDVVRLVDQEYVGTRIVVRKDHVENILCKMSRLAVCHADRQG